MQDGALADGGMVLARINAQAGDAVELTRRALEYAEREGKKPGSRAPEVTVTGHSLGGCLAQITAHHFGLKGETFNAYGAVSLSMRIPERGDTVINHVMAGDPVSAASKHFGQVRVYATQQETERLVTLGGYENNRSQLDMRSPGPAVVSLLGSHSLHHFRNVDGNGRPDHSVLIDPHARELAEKFAPMIGKYRNDTAMMRSIVTVGSRGQYGAVMDGMDHLRGPLPPGQPAAREARAAEAWAAAVNWKELNGIASPNRPLVPSASAAQPYTPESTGPNGPLSLPDYLEPNASPRIPMKPDISLHGSPQAAISPHHPDHALYAEMKQRLPPDTSEERLAQITLAAKQGGVKAGQVDSVHITENPLRMLVSGKVPGDRAQVDLTTSPPSVQETLQRSEVYDQQNAQQQAQWQAQSQQLNQSGHGMGARVQG